MSRDWYFGMESKVRSFSRLDTARTSRLSSMSLSSILQNITKKGQVQKPHNAAPQTSNGSKLIMKTPMPERTVDPVVARLKEKRRLENAKKEDELRAKKGLPAKVVSSRPNQKTPSTAQKSQNKSAVKPIIQKTKNTIPAGLRPTLGKPVVPKVPGKKMNFNDLMKRALTIDQSKLSISLKSKVAPPAKPQAKPERPRSREPQPQHFQQKSQPQHSQQQRQHVKSKPVKHTPIPLRAPSSTLQQKLQRKRTTEPEEEDDSDMEDFVVSDEERKRTEEYDRDEIWAIFNKGKKRSYYNYDDDSADDMEATGAEILEEEMRSKRRAELEDRKEWEEEQRRSDLKKKRRNY